MAHGVSDIWSVLANGGNYFLIRDETAGAYRMAIDSGGKSGIGTTSPGAKLHVVGSEARLQTDNAYLSFFNTGGTRQGYLQSASGVMYLVNEQNAPTVFYTNNAERVRIDAAGNVGIGMTPSSSYKLDVNGDVRVSGNIAARYQDVAEWVPSSEQLSAGTVVVLDSNKSNQVTSSTVSYDTRVAGVVSEQPGITLGEKSDGKVLVATTGRVRVKVDASKSDPHRRFASHQRCFRNGNEIRTNCDWRSADSRAGNTNRQSARTFGKR